MSETVPETKTETTKKNNNIVIAIVILVIALAVAGGAYFFLKDKSSNNIDIAPDLESALYINGRGPVAKVNGAEISRSDYRTAINQFIANYANQGVTITTEDADIVKDEVVNSLINRKLVLDAAHEADITVSDSEIESEIQTILENFGSEEAMETALKANNITKSQLETEIKEGIIINKYLESRIDTNSITVTDEEVSNYYDIIKQSNGEDVPPLEEVAEIIKSQMVSDKKQQAFAAEIEKIRAEAEIEVLI